MEYEQKHIDRQRLFLYNGNTYGKGRCSVMGRKIDEFLDKYKRAETLMRKLGCEGGFKEAEERLAARNASDPACAKLRMCRLMRNFAVHEPDGAAFLEPGSGRWEPCSYLDVVIRGLVAETDTVSKHLDRGAKAVLSWDMNVGEALVAMSSRRATGMAVLDGKKHLVGTVDIFEVCAASAKSRATRLKKYLENRKTCGQKAVSVAAVGSDTAMSSLPKADIIVCTRDGTPEGTVIGIVKGV